MQKTIWKFTITPTKLTVKMPKGAELLSVQTQNNMACIWALVYPENKPEERFFEVFGTGHDVPCDMGIDRKFIGTFQLDAGSLVFHLFERL